MENKGLVRIVVILALWSVLATILAAYLYFKKPPEHIDNSFLESQIEELRSDNNDLQDQIDQRDGDISRRDAEIDSLKGAKPEIQIKYVTIYKEIDNSTAIDIVELSDSILSIENIDR